MISNAFHSRCSSAAEQLAGALVRAECRPLGLRGFAAEPSLSLSKGSGQAQVPPQLRGAEYAAGPRPKMATRRAFELSDRACTLARVRPGLHSELTSLHSVVASLHSGLSSVCARGG